MIGPVLNQLVRYAPVLAMLRGEHDTLLEIGSGSDGIAAYLRRPAFGLEIRFPAPPHELLIAVGGTATDLPFADRSVDVVLIMDTLEHIPPHLRARCLEEAMRVAARRIIVGGPMGPGARSADVELASYYRQRDIEVPAWLAEHLSERAPDVEDVLALLRDSGWTVEARGNENKRAHVALMKLETRSLAYRVLGRIRRHAPRPTAALARALRIGPYYSWLVDARRSTAADQASSIRDTSGPQS
jgi:hypothetical protein